MRDINDILYLCGATFVNTASIWGVIEFERKEKGKE